MPRFSLRLVCVLNFILVKRYESKRKAFLARFWRLNDCDRTNNGPRLIRESHLSAIDSFRMKRKVGR